MTASMTFGTTSLANLAGVDPRLVTAAKMALSFSTQDFGFPDPNTRTLAQEEALVAQGKSHTLKSHHIPPPAPGKGTFYNGVAYSGAVDCVPWNGNAFVWDWNLIYLIWHAWRRVAELTGNPYTWGGVWDKLITEYDDPESEMNAYIARQKAAGNEHPFVDGPHFEWGPN